MKRNEFAKLDQAMETLGGARVGCDSKTSEAGVRIWDLAIRASTSPTTIDVADGCGCADWDVVTARQQSRLQQAMPRTVRWSDSPIEP
jgi:hypothetical protein